MALLDNLLRFSENGPRAQLIDSEYRSWRIISNGSVRDFLRLPASLAVYPIPVGLTVGCVRELLQGDARCRVLHSIRSGHPPVKQSSSTYPVVVEVGVDIWVRPSDFSAAPPNRAGQAFSSQ
jgi:hypothetical protein